MPRAATFLILIVMMAGFGTAEVVVQPVPSPLPYGGVEFGAAALGDTTYLFGGFSCANPCNQIMRFNSTTLRAEILGARLPYAVALAPAVSHDGFVYLLGGYPAGGGSLGPTPLRSILKFDPVSETIHILETELPSGRYGSAAAVVGSNIYVFGGYEQSRMLNHVVEVNLTSSVVRTLPVTLPGGLAGVVAVSDGARIILIGGTAGDGRRSADVHSFNPANETFERLPMRLPSARANAAGVWTPAGVFLAGGDTDSATSREIVRLDPTRFRVAVEQTTLSQPVASHSATLHGGSAYLFGGRGGAQDGDRQITRIEIATLPGQARAVNATANATSVKITWEPPITQDNAAEARYLIYDARTDVPRVLGITSETQYVDTNVTGGEYLSYRIAARNWVGEGPTSGLASARVWTTPSSPIDMQASRGPELGSVILQWAPPADDGGSTVVNYTVYRSSDDGFEPIAVVNRTQYTDNILWSGLSSPDIPLAYHYRVTAMNAVGEGPHSTEVCTHPGPRASRICTLLG